MKFKELEEILSFLKNVKNNNSEKIQFLYDELKKIETKLPTIEELDNIQKVALDLAVEYDDLVELDIYFNPIYIKVKRKIKEEYIKKLRESNKEREV